VLVLTSSDDSSTQSFLKPYMVLAGEGVVFTVGPRSFVSLPRGTPHAWDVGGEGVATLLMMTVPAMLEEFLQQFHAASTREDRDAIAAEYGIQFLWDRS
jgi:hypothetical protein